MKLEKMIKVGNVVQMRQESLESAIREGSSSHLIFETAKVIGIIPGPKSIKQRMAGTNESTDILRVAVCGTPFAGSQTNEFSPVFQVLAGAVEIAEKGKN
tara:strand:+ start:383 stop:682 length:300 start_codon:yes stop_codon:yes gene_type:complete